MPWKNPCFGCIFSPLFFEILPLGPFFPIYPVYFVAKKQRVFHWAANACDVLGILRSYKNFFWVWAAPKKCFSGEDFRVQKIILLDLIFPPRRNYNKVFCWAIHIFPSPYLWWALLFFLCPFLVTIELLRAKIKQWNIKEFCYGKSLFQRVWQRVFERLPL